MMFPSRVISVLVADDHSVVREGIRRVIETEMDIKVCAEAENGRQVLEEIERHRPDVVILDINMPEMGGLGLASERPPSSSATPSATASSTRSRSERRSSLEHGERFDVRRLRKEVEDPQVGELEVGVDEDAQISREGRGVTR